MEILKKYWLFFVILISGVLFRLINLDKAGGLWYDEMTIYSIASDFNADIHRFLLFPVYYFVYHLWITLFGNSDFVIRLMSVFFDVLGIVSAYFAGKQICKGSHKTGLIYMLLFALNSSFIYYAQEAKFYSITFFIINLLIIAWLKYFQEPRKRFLLYFYCVSLALILTYTSQSLLVLLFYGASIVCKKFSKRELLIFPTVFLPIGLLCLIIPRYFSGNFDAVVYDNSFILLALQNWFSPLLSGLQNNILNYQGYVLSHLLNLNFIIFVLFPVAFVLYGIVRGFKDNLEARYLFGIAAIYVGLHIVFTMAGNYNVLVRYTLPVLPLMLLVSAVGLSSIKKKVFTGFFILVNILGILSVSGAPRIPRPDGYRALAETLKANEINSSSDFILPIRTELLDKYYDISGAKYSLYVLNSAEAQNTYLTADEISALNSADNKNRYYKRFLLSKEISPEFETYVQDNFIKNKNLVLLKDTSICVFTDEQLEVIANSENFEKYPLQFMRMSKLNNDLVKVLSRKMTLKQNFNHKNWEIFVFEL